MGSTCTDGLEIVLTEDGPEAAACLCPRCVGRAKFAARTDTRQGFTAAMTVPDDEAW